jgi:hypothetical protein
VFLGTQCVIIDGLTSWQPENSVPTTKEILHVTIKKTFSRIDVDLISWQPDHTAKKDKIVNAFGTYTSSVLLLSCSSKRHDRSIPVASSSVIINHNYP